MNDFVNDFWYYYIVILVIGSLLYCAWVLAANMTKRKPGPVELHGHTWDENLQEYNNPLPRWWLYLFWLTLIFAVVYLWLWPYIKEQRLGQAKWSGVQQYKEEMVKAEARYAPIFDKYLQQDIKTLAKNPEAHAMGQRLFLTYCAQCHGADARGSKGFPNLTDNDWLHGGEPETIEKTILGGRNGMMPALGPTLGGENTKDVANYVRSLSNLGHDSLRAQRGKEIFSKNCVACHGAEGKGNPALGSANLTDKTWLYGSSETTIIETITKGRTNRMPTFEPIIGKAKVHLLAAYVYSLSHKE